MWVVFNSVDKKCLPTHRALLQACHALVVELVAALRKKVGAGLQANRAPLPRIVWTQPRALLAVVVVRGLPALLCCDASPFAVWLLLATAVVSPLHRGGDQITPMSYRTVS